MEIRELNSDDLSSLIELYIQLDECNKDISIEKALSTWKSEIETDRKIKYFGAIDKGKVVSTCYCVIIPNITSTGRSICFVENVVTDKAYRKQGLGRKIIEKAIETARENDCYKVILQSNMKRKEAHQFYENLGFDGNLKKAFDLRLDVTI